MKIEPLDITPALRRKVARDVLPDRIISDCIPKLGMVPGSDQGDLVEQRSSQIRLNTLKPIWTITQTLSGMAGEIAGRAILESLGYEFEIADSDPDLIQYQKLVQAAVPAVIANLLDLGLLKMGTNQ